MTVRTEAPTALPGSTSTASATEVWGSTQWRQEALRWIDAYLESHGTERLPTIPPQPRLRPWSTLLVIDTVDHQRLWFKAGLPELSPETRIMTQLRKVAPDSIAAAVAVDHERRWSLTPDLGRTMHDEGLGSDVSRLSALLRVYARVQRASASVSEKLRRDAVPVMTPQTVARELLSMRVSPDIAHAVRAAAGRLEDLSLPLTIHHADLHPGNVYVTNSAPASFQAVIGDWGDATLANPLTSLLSPMRHVRSTLSAADGEVAAQRLTRAYLSCWSDLAPSGRLKAAIPDALFVAKAHELVTWRRALSRATHDERVQWGTYGANTLREMAEQVRHDS